VRNENADFRNKVLSILVPVYNERPYLRHTIESVISIDLPAGLQKEIIIVDDCSTDGTQVVIKEVVEQYPGIIRAFYHDKNMGKGAAIRTATHEMTGQIAIFQDADLEYDPADYPALLEPILQGHADVVYGSRFSLGRMKRVLNYHHAKGNKFLTNFSNTFTGLALTDMETCYKVFRADLLKTIPLRSNRFGIEPEITAKIAKRNCKVYEVPVSYKGRTYLEGKKIGWKDGISTVLTVLKYWILDDCYNEEYGAEILSTLSQARRFNNWMVKVIKPYLGNRIFEIGAGIGNVSRQLPQREKLIVSDYEQRAVAVLEDVFMYNELVEVHNVDITKKSTVETVGSGICDTVVCLNVLEHIEDDTDALRNMRHLLEPGGRLVLLVPQYPRLFGTYDRSLGHHRRYTRKMLDETLRQAGFRVQRIFNFNFPAIFGWILTSQVFKKKSFSKWQIKFFDIMTPAFDIIERYLPLPGISLIAIAESTSDH